MKTLFLIPILAASCVWSQESRTIAAPVTDAPATLPAAKNTAGSIIPAAAPAAQAPDLQTYVNAGNQVAQAMAELTEVLRLVNSKETADASCETVKKAALKLLAASRAAESLPAPSEELQTGLVEKLQQNGFIDITQRFLQTLMVLAAHECYESEALQEALKILEDADADN